MITRIFVAIQGGLGFSCRIKAMIIAESFVLHLSCEKLGPSAWKTSLSSTSCSHTGLNISGETSGFHDFQPEKSQFSDANKSLPDIFRALDLEHQRSTSSTKVSKNILLQSDIANRY